MCKKMIFSLMAAMCTVIILSIAQSLSSNASETNGFSQDLIDTSEIRPQLFISVDGTQGGKVFSPSDAGKTVEVCLCVKDAYWKYASTKLHVFFKGVKIVDDEGEPYAVAGGAIKKLAKDVPFYDYTIDGIDGVCVVTAGSKDVGNDGIMWTFLVKIPETAKAGDVFSIDIMYRSEGDDEDLFASCNDTEASKLMQAYAFTRGIYNKTVNYSFAASADDIKKCPALADIDRSVDGYIAIAAPSVTTTVSTMIVPQTTTTISTMIVPQTSTYVSTMIVPQTSTYVSTMIVPQTSTYVSTMIVSQTTTTSVVPDLGDINDDKKVDAKDASEILVYYSKMSTGAETKFTEKQLISANINGDSLIDAKDASLILSYYSYISTHGAVSLSDFINGNLPTSPPVDSVTQEW